MFEKKYEFIKLRAGLFFGEVIIFLILIVLLKKAVWKSLTKYLNERRNVSSDSQASIENVWIAADKLKKETEFLNKKH